MLFLSATPRRLIAALACFTLLLNGAPVLASTDQPSLALAHTIAVVEYPFSNAPSALGQGLNVDLVSAALNAQNIPHQFVYLPIKRALKWFEESRYTGLIGTNRLFAAEVQSALTLVELDPEHVRFFYYKEHTPHAKLQSLADLRTYSVAGTHSNQRSIAKYAKELIQADSPETILRMVRLGRSSLGMVIESTGMHLIQQLYPDEINNFGIVSRSVRKERVGLVINRPLDTGAVLERNFQRGLEKIKRTGEFEQIKRHYYGKAYPLLQGLSSEPLFQDN